jgi:TRAP transporter TAXI family solute receptor
MDEQSAAGVADDEDKTFLERHLPKLSVSYGLYFLQTMGPLLVVIGIVIFLALHFLRPAPPDRLTIASGPIGSRFETYANDYRRILARSGVTVTVLITKGSLENLERLNAPKSTVDVALVQTGIAGSPQATGTAAGVPATDAATANPDLRSLGSVAYQLLTIFYRSAKPIERLSELKGKRIATGPQGSGTEALALALLAQNEIVPHESTTLLDLEGEAARAALLHGQVDAIFLSGDSASGATIREMLHAPGIRLFDFPQADAYVRRFPYLSKLEIPAGAFDLGENLPPERIVMLAPTVELVARAELHPALSDLLIEAATEANGKATLLQNAGQFPTPLMHDLPVSADATRFYTSGKSFTYRYFPFWLATLLNRAFVVTLPIFLVAIPALRYVPALYNWRIRSRIDRRYKQLMALERESLGELSTERRELLLARLADIEKSVIKLKMPGSHAEQLYVFRQHMKFVRDNLEQVANGRAAATPTATPAAATPAGGVT